MKKLGIVISLILFFACEKDVVLDDNLTFKPKLVINGQSEVDRLMWIDISSTVGPNRPVDSLNLTGWVEVQLRKDDEVIFTNYSPISDGKFLLPHRPQAGHKYEIQLKYPDLPSIAAIDSVPMLAPIFEIDSVIKQRDYLEVEISIENLPEDNFYFLTLESSGELITGLDTTDYDKPLNFESTDKIFISSLRTWIQPGAFVLFDEQLFFDSTNSFALQIPNNELYSPTFNPKKLNVKISSISRAMYFYYINLLENNPIYGGPLANVKADFGNVEQGLGIFCFKYSSQATIDID